MTYSQCISLWQMQQKRKAHKYTFTFVIDYGLLSLGWTACQWILLSLGTDLKRHHPELLISSTNVARNQSSVHVLLLYFEKIDTRKLMVAEISYHLLLQSSWRQLPVTLIKDNGIIRITI